MCIWVVELNWGEEKKQRQQRGKKEDIQIINVNENLHILMDIFKNLHSFSKLKEKEKVNGKITCIDI